MTDTRILTREALYALVWAEPISKVAPRFNLSNRGLAKICESRNIPVPPRGYWAKLAHGHKVAQMTLPPWKGEGDGRIYLDGEPKPVEVEEPVPPEIAFEQRPENRIPVPTRLGRIHPLTERTRSLIKGTGAERDGRFAPHRGGGLNIVVSRALFPRALRIMNALVLALEKRGHQISVGIGARDKQFTFATILGEKIAFRIVERLKRVEAKSGDYRWQYAKKGERDDPWDLGPTGRLALEVGEWYQERGIEDGATPIEERLNDFVIRLLKEAFKDKAQRERREREAAARREQERLRAIEEEKRLAEEKRIQEWDRLMGAWRKAREVRVFVRMIRRRIGPEDGSDLANRLLWAEQYADRIDPLNKSL